VTKQVAHVDLCSLREIESALDRIDPLGAKIIDVPALARELARSREPNEDPSRVSHATIK